MPEKEKPPAARVDIYYLYYISSFDFNCENALYILALCVLCLFLHFPPKKGERTVGGTTVLGGDYYENQRWWVSAPEVIRYLYYNPKIFPDYE